MNSKVMVLRDYSIIAIWGIIFVQETQKTRTEFVSITFLVTPEYGGSTFIKRSIVISTLVLITPLIADSKHS